MTTSWIIRTKNEEKWLGQVLEKLFTQSRQDFEVLIVDSGSTDKTLQIVAKFPIRKIIKIKPEEFTYGRALNIGIAETKSEFAGILSGHSLPVSNVWYEQGMAGFTVKVAAVTGYTVPLPDASWDEKLDGLVTLWKRFRREEDVRWMSNTNSIIRKSLWQKYPFDEKLLECEDYDWAQEMHSRGWRIVADHKFNVCHSHGGLGRSTNWQRSASWRKTINLINQKSRPTPDVN